MSDIGTTLSEVCAAFNAHDLDKIMTFFAEGARVKVQGCDFYTFREDGKVIREDSDWKIIASAE